MYVFIYYTRVSYEKGIVFLLVVFAFGSNWYSFASDSCTSRVGNLIQNCSFESFIPSWGWTPIGFWVPNALYGINIGSLGLSDWSIGNLSGNNFALLFPNTSPNNTYGGPIASDGNRSIDVSGNGNRGPGFVEQIVSTVPGYRYRWLFDLSPGTNTFATSINDPINLPSPSIVEVSVNWNSVAVLSNSSFGYSFYAGWSFFTSDLSNRNQVSYDFTATSSTSTLRFTNRSDTPNDWTNIDNMSLLVFIAASPDTGNVLVPNTGIINLLSNDMYSSVPATTWNIVVSLTGLVTISWASIDSDGRLIIPAYTASGVYNIPYQICELSNTSNCSLSYVDVTVTTTTVLAVDDYLTGVAGVSGVVDILSNDSYGSISATTGTVIVSLTGSSSLTGLSIDSNGMVIVPANTMSGVYAINYQICESIYITNCSVGSLTVTISLASIVAVFDTINTVEGTTGNLHVLLNDMYNGWVPTTGDVMVTLVGALSITGLVIDSDGVLIVPSTATSGSYNIKYQICERSMIVNCSTSSIDVSIASAPLSYPIVSNGFAWGGGGWMPLIKDNCPWWDYTLSYYDNDCGTYQALPIISTGLVVNAPIPTKKNLYHGVAPHPTKKVVTIKNPLRKRVGALHFELPHILPQTGTPVDALQAKWVSVINNYAMDTTMYDRIRPVSRAMYKKHTKLSYWLRKIPNEWWYENDKKMNSYIVIPRLGIVAPVQHISPDRPEYTSVIKWGTAAFNDRLHSGVLQYPGTSNPGAVGNTVILWHSSYFSYDQGRYKTIFTAIPLLEQWDEIWIYTTTQWTGSTNRDLVRQSAVQDTYEGYDRYVYKVSTSFETQKENVDVLKPLEWSSLTLITCTPIGTAKNRWVVQALIDAPDVIQYERKRRTS